MRIRITPEAQAQLEERKRWWRQNRDKAPDRFDLEFVAAARRISTSPMSFPVFTEKRGRSIRRCLMPKSQCHLYFEIVEGRSEISIVAAGGAGVGRRRGFGFKRMHRRKRVAYPRGAAAARQ